MSVYTLYVITYTIAAVIYMHTYIYRCGMQSVRQMVFVRPYLVWFHMEIKEHGNFDVLFMYLVEARYGSNLKLRNDCETIRR